MEAENDRDQENDLKKEVSKFKKKQLWIRKFRKLSIKPHSRLCVKNTGLVRLPESKKLDVQ